MITRPRSILSSLAALVALALIVVGLPVVLYRFGGSPLPGQMPSVQRITTVLSSRDDGTMLLGIIRACSWLAWLLFTACVLAEAQAAIRGRRAPHLRLGGFQGAAAHLVALSALAFTAPAAVTLSASVTGASQPAELSLGSPHGAAGTPTQSREMLTLVASRQALPSSSAGSLRAPTPVMAAPTADDASASRLVTVQRGDCLWSLAQRYLGDGDRYTEIASLNRGRDMGNGLVFRNPSLIETGWRLLIPANTAASPGQPPTVGGHHLGHPTADQHYRRRHRAATNGPAHPVVRNNEGNGATAPGPAPTAGVGAGSNPSMGTASGANSGTNSGADRTSVAAGQVSYRTSASENPPRALLPDAAYFVTGAFAGAVLTSLARLRRRQQQHRRRGRRIRLPGAADVLATEQRLRAAGPTEQLTTLRDALACLEASILGAGQELPEIVGVHVTPDVLEVLLAAPAADGPPAPFAITPGRQGMCWQLDLPATVSVPAGRRSNNGSGFGGLACHLMPGLITAGATSNGYLLLDLESMPVTGCDGPPDLVDKVITTIATELATGQWSGWYDLILVGCDEVADLGRAEHCATLDQAIDLIASRRTAAAPRIAARAPAEVRELRLAEPENEDWGLTVLVSRTEPSAEQMTRLLQLAEDGPGGIAVLVAGDPESDDGRMAPAVFQVAPDPERSAGIIANIVPFQLIVRPLALSAAEYDAIGSLLAAAADLADVGEDEEPYLAYTAPPWIPQATDLGAEPGPDSEPWPGDNGEIGDTMPERTPAPDDCWGQEISWDPDARWDPDASSEPDRSWAPQLGQVAATDESPRLEISILGPFAITGAAEQLQPKQAELVLALALAAPAGLSNSALCTMLGTDPDHPKPADAVRQIITRTRRRLGLAADGQEYIIHAGNGQYVLHPDASLDWSRFRELVATGRANDMRAAVSLIKGQPFTGSYFWWIDIPLAETVRAEIVDAADTLAEFELAIGSPRAAGKAARAGLMAEASAEQLWRAVMRAEHAAGNLAGVAEAWRHCLDAIADIAPDGEPHPDTEALYRQLTETARQHAQAR